MKKENKISILRECKDKTQMARVFFKYDPVYYYYYPNEVNDKFVLGQKEDDFILDGYHIRKVSHITRVEIKDDLCTTINARNGVAGQVHSPGIDISSWNTIFEDLRKHQGFLIIEDDINRQFAIGVVLEVKKNHLLLRQFDANGIWQEDLLKIPYSSITHVAWDTRYAKNWYDFLNENN